MDKSESIISQLRQVVLSLPQSPGVYQFFNDKDQIIYIGKAKKLKNRVASYFNKNHQRYKIDFMVRKIRRIETINVNTEWEALLLENTLIKKYKPYYNSMLKDDKTYPWLAVLKEDFPRLVVTRKTPRNGSRYFGPYPSGKQLKHLLELIYELYPIRSCALNLSPENIAKGKYTVCLKYHIHKCEGACVGKILPERHQFYIDNIVKILKGDMHLLLKQLKIEMMEAADSWNFEKAQLIKEKLNALESYQSKYTVVNPAVEEADVMTLISDKENSYVNYMRIVKGVLVLSYTQQIKSKIKEEQEDLLLMALFEMRERFGSYSKEVILPFKPNYELENIQVVVPQKGDKLKLLELSERNARFYILEQHKREDKLNSVRSSERIVKTMQDDLKLDKPPHYIESFDNSNLQGTYPVAAMVCFRDGKPSKKEYRLYNIKTVEGPNDFASMEEIIYRRYKRLLDENKPLPDLILVDGGKGQVSSAYKSLKKLKLEKTIPLLGIAKRLEDIYRPGDSLPLYLDKKSETQRILQHLRDEVHRFGITHQRKRREKAGMGTLLTEIKGIGQKTAELLLKTYKSVAKIKTLTIDELAQTVGKDKAVRILEELNKTE